MIGFTIGTAGHVDHGKTLLIKALTGMDTDRLKEERERGISIELGFAFLDLPGGKRAGIIDVPGHERFIKNMLAGVGGIDAVMLVIAADEGVMPQTREHLDIMQLLQVKYGVVVLTKTDVVDEEWIVLIREEVESFLKGTVLENAPIIEVSSITGRGIDFLQENLNRMADLVERRSASGPMRLPIDRIFSVTGFGTVVTGTLLAGSAGVGDVVEVLPQCLHTRIRNVHVHGKKVERVEAGQRVAINLAGLEVEQLSRGNVVAAVGYLKPSRRLDVRLQYLENTKALTNRVRVRIYLGTAEVFGRVKFLDRDELGPGAWAYAQLELEDKVVAVRGDRFVIRSYSPMKTIGGGSVIEANPGKHRRYKKDVVDSMIMKEKGSPGDLILQVLNNKNTMLSFESIVNAAGLSNDDIVMAMSELCELGSIRYIEGESSGYYMSMEGYRRWGAEVSTLIQTFHDEYPLRSGYPKEELRSRKFNTLNSRQFQLFLKAMETDGIIASTGITISHPGFVAEPGPELKDQLSFIESKYKLSLMSPPFWSNVVDDAGIVGNTVGVEILNFLIRNGILIKVADDLYFHSSMLVVAKERLVDYFRSKKSITVGEARDLFGTSRKYALPLLEYFDREKITRRVGDDRMPGKEIKSV